MRTLVSIQLSGKAALQQRLVGAEEVQFCYETSFVKREIKFAPFVTLGRKLTARSVGRRRVGRRYAPILVRRR